MRTLVLPSVSLLLVASLFACGAPGVVEEPRTPQEIRPWKAHFTSPQSMIADEVAIVGLDGLLEHVALDTDPALHVYSTETTPEGLLQTVEMRPGLAADATPIRVVVDSLDIRALRRVSILQKKFEAPQISIVAEGNVWWAREDGRGQLRERRVVLPGDLPAELLEASADVFDEWR